jgi:cyclase
MLRMAARWWSLVICGGLLEDSRLGNVALRYNLPMSRTLLVRVFAGTLFLLITWVGYTQNKGGPPPLTLNKVKEDLYIIEGDGGNVAVYVTNEGVILVDDKYEPDFEGILAKVKSVTSQPIKYILSTHHHADHSGGNTKFAAVAEIISTANARANIVQHKQSNAPANMVPARVVFTEETAVFLGGKEARARYFGRGHTNGDAIIYFPALRTLHTGDLMAGKTPLIDYPGGGSVVEWTKTLDEAMKLDFDTVIPGHGPVTDKPGLLAYRNNVEKLRNRAAGLIREGKSQDEIGKVMIAEFGWAANGLQMQWSLPGMIAELR